MKPQIFYGPPKFEDEELDYQFNWTNRLKDETGEVVDSIVSAAVTDMDEAVEIDRVTTASNETTFWVGPGGVAGYPLKVNLLARSAGGRDYGAQLYIPIKKR